MTELKEIRSIETVTAEIVAIRGYAQRVVLSSAVEIGRRLKEAKELLPYGEWGGWLAERVDFSQVTATRYMKLFDEYAQKQGSLFGAEVDISTLKNLSVSNALRLMALPEEEREEFAAEHDVENISARKMDELIRELEEEKKRSAEAGREAGEIKAELTDAKSRIRELESRPVEVAVEKPDPAEVKKLVDEALENAKAGFEKKERALNDKLAAAKQEQAALLAREQMAKQAKTEAEKKLAEASAEQAAVVDLEKKRLENQIGELRKKLAMSDAAVAGFRVLYDQTQDILGRLLAAMTAIEDEQTREKLRAAVQKLLTVYGEKAQA